MIVPDNGQAVHTRAPDGELDIALYSSLTDTVPQPRRVSWDTLADDLAEHDERSEKDGPGWSATVYISGKTRGKAGVEDVTAAVLDVDHDEPIWSLLDGLEYVAHTTWKHHAGDEHEDCQGRGDCPHWRIVLPLKRPVPVTEWDAFRQQIRFWLCPNADESAKDAPRFFWLPTCRPGTLRDSRRQHGRWLDPDEPKPIPDDEPRKRVTVDSTPGVEFEPATNDTGERPGDRFEREADWLRDLLPGWVPVGVHGDNLMIRRPGSTNPYGATISKRGQGVLYVFTNNAAPLEADTCYSKFGAYTTREHGGDFKAAAKAIAERYGTHTRRNGHAKDGVPTNRDGSDHQAPHPTRRPLTETGNAERLVDRHGADIRFSYPWGQWLNWDGKRYQRDLTGAIMARAKEAVRSIYGEAQAAENDAERAALAAWAKRSETAGARSAMVKLAESEKGVPILPEDMDADPFLFNVLNGTIDLRTGRLRPHDRADNITKLAPVLFDPKAECPTFLAFIEHVLPDPDVRAFLQRMTGYAMTGDTSEQCLCFMCGGGANGKSTFIGVIQYMLGDYARQAAPELLVSRGGDRHPTELADLFGARLVTSIEVDEGKRLAETLVKQMTGGDKMKARFMRQDFFEWVPTHKLFLAANHRPEIRGTDYAIWRRIHLVPFTVTIPEDERDPKLGEKLRAELPGILNWAIAGCLAWQRNGLGVPQAVKDATEEYRQEQDVLADFLDEHCVIDPQAYAVAGPLHKLYTTWCENGVAKALNQQAFGRRLTERGFKADKPRIGGKQTRIWRGLRIANATDDPSGTHSELRYGLRRENADSGSSPSRESDMPDFAYQSVPGDESVPEGSPVCDTDGCMNAVPGRGLHCEACLYADVEDEVPFE